MKGVVQLHEGYPYIDVDVPPHGVVPIFRFAQNNHMLKQSVVAFGPEFADKLDYVEFQGMQLTHHVKNKGLARLVSIFANGGPEYSIPGQEIELAD